VGLEVRAPEPVVIEELDAGDSRGSLPCDRAQASGRTDIARARERDQSIFE